MNVVRTGVWLQDIRPPRQQQDRALNEDRAIAIVAQIPLIIAAFHRHRQDLPLPEIRGTSAKPPASSGLLPGEEPTAEATRTLDVAYILHADHGMNASTFSARVTIATLSDMYSAITSAIGTLKGPLHGGANEGVIHVSEEIGSRRQSGRMGRGTTRERKLWASVTGFTRWLDPRPASPENGDQTHRQLGEPKWIRMSERIATIMRERREQRSECQRRFLQCDRLLQASVFRPISSHPFLPSPGRRLDCPGAGAA